MKSSSGLSPAARDTRRSARRHRPAVRLRRQRWGRDDHLSVAACARVMRRATCSRIFMPIMDSLPLDRGRRGKMVTRLFKRYDVSEGKEISQDTHRGLSRALTRFGVVLVFLACLLFLPGGKAG